MPKKLLGLVACLFITSIGISENRPNILLITADDFGLQLSCYGDPVIKTPHLDRLAERSVRFETAYTAQASCSPARASIFTGIYPHGNGQYGLAHVNEAFRVHPQLIVQLLPNRLKREGYRTGLIGKLHVNPEDQFTFDLRSMEGFMSRDIRLQSRLAQAFIDQENNAPWFLMFNLFDPHAAYGPLDANLSPTYFPDQIQGLPEEVLSADEVPPWPWQQIDNPAQRQKIAGYYNSVARLDSAIGLLMKVLDQTGHSEDTLIIFIGDHGPPFTRAKISCYEAGLRVPFLIHWPGVSEPHVSDSLVSTVDIYPTLLDATGIPLPKGLHGRSLRPVMTLINTEEWRDTLVGEYHYHSERFFPRRAITDGRYKLIHNLHAGELFADNSADDDKAYDLAIQLPAGHPARQAMERLVDPPEWELYDLETDPIEFNELANDKSYSPILVRLQQELFDWQEETADPFRDPDFRRSVEKKFRITPISRFMKRVRWRLFEHWKIQRYTGYVLVLVAVGGLIALRAIRWKKI